MGRRLAGFVVGIVCDMSVMQQESLDVAESIRNKVSAIIVCYGTNRELKATISTVLESAVTDIILVDNGAGDGKESVEHFLEILDLEHMNCKKKHIRVLKPLVNRGFGAGVNFGARETSRDYLLVLNPDVHLKAGALEHLIAVLLNDPKVAIVGPKILNQDGSIYPSVRRFPTIIGATHHAILGKLFPENPATRKYHRKDAPSELRAYADWVSGSCMLIRRDSFVKLKGFDERFFLYLEDLDLCYRANQLGKFVCYEPGAEVLHFGASTTSNKPRYSILEHHRSAFRFEEKILRGWKRIFLIPAWLFLYSRCFVLLSYKTLKEQLRKYVR